MAFALLFDVFEVVEGEKVINFLELTLISRLGLLCQEVESLLRHYCVVALEGRRRAVLADDPVDARPGGVASSAE